MDVCIKCEDKLNKGKEDALYYCELCRDKKETESKLKEVTGLNIEI